MEETTAGENNNNNNGNNSNNNNEVADATATLLPPPPPAFPMEFRWDGNSLLPKRKQQNLSPIELFTELEFAAQKEYLGEYTYDRLINQGTKVDETLKEEKYLKQITFSPTT
jgi:hypothetical protein